MSKCFSSFKQIHPTVTETNEGLIFALFSDYKDSGDSLLLTVVQQLSYKRVTFRSSWPFTHSTRWLAAVDLGIIATDFKEEGRRNSSTVLFKPNILQEFSTYVSFVYNFKAIPTWKGSWGYHTNHWGVAKIEIHKGNKA